MPAIVKAAAPARPARARPPDGRIAAKSRQASPAGAPATAAPTGAGLQHLVEQGRDRAEPAVELERVDEPRRVAFAGAEVAVERRAAIAVEPDPVEAVGEHRAHERQPAVAGPGVQLTTVSCPGSRFASSSARRPSMPFPRKRWFACGLSRSMWT